MNNLLPETNQAQSRKLFFGCLFIVLVPLVLHLVDRPMSALHPKQPHSQQQPPPSESPSSSGFDLRSM